MLEYTTTEEVMFFDTDCGGVVHNLAYLRMIETCRTKLAEKMGMNLQSMSKTQQFPVLVSTEIQYKKPAVLGDKIKTIGKLTQIKGAKFWCSFEMVDEQTQTLLITCTQSLALVQMPKGKPLRLPAHLRELVTNKT